jgi:hypothetical protein
MTPALWCEARCYFFHAGARKDGTNACHETAPGAFGRRNAEKEARRAGWRVMDGEWACPACWRATYGRREPEV